MRSSDVWAVDSLVGHLAVAERMGMLGQLMGRATKCYYDSADFVQALDEFGPPAGVLVAAHRLDEVLGVLADLPDVKVLVIDYWGPAPPNLPRNVALDRSPTYQALALFGEKLREAEH